MNLDQHLAVVVTNDKDPDKEYGIEIRCDSIGMDGSVLPVIAKPMFPSSMLKIPEIGQIVKIMVLANDSDDDDESEDRGTIDFPDFIYYDHRILDSQSGKLTTDFKKNYPRRCGFWLEDGSLFYFDDTKNQKEFMVKLTDGKNFMQITESKITIDQNGTKIELENGTMTSTVDITELGASGASHPITLGDILKTYLETVQSGFGATHTHTFTGSVAGAVLVAPPTPAVCSGVTGVPSPIMPVVPSNLNSTKHKMDS